MSEEYLGLELSELSPDTMATIYATKRYCEAHRSEGESETTDWYVVLSFVNLELQQSKRYIEESIAYRAYDRAQLYLGLNRPIDDAVDYTTLLSRRVIRGLTPNYIADIFWMRYRAYSWDDIVKIMKKVDGNVFRSNPKRLVQYAYGIGCARMFLPEAGEDAKHVQYAFTRYRDLQNIQASDGWVSVSLIEENFGDRRVTRHRKRN